MLFAAAGVKAHLRVGALSKLYPPYPGVHNMHIHTAAIILAASMPAYGLNHAQAIPKLLLDGGAYCCIQLLLRAKTAGKGPGSKEIRTQQRRHSKSQCLLTGPHALPAKTALLPLMSVAQQQQHHATLLAGSRDIRASPALHTSLDAAVPASLAAACCRPGSTTGALTSLS